LSEVETCTRCGGPLKSREELTQLLQQIRRDAQAAVTEHEPTDDPLERLQAEIDYMEVAISQVVSELKGVCSECWERVEDA
jgi:hypothetical protein